MPIIPIGPPPRPLGNAPDAVLDREKRPTIDNSGQMQAVGQLAKAGQMPLLPAEKLAAPYEAMGAVGRALYRTGSVIGALAEKKLEAEIDNQTSAYSAMMDAEWNDHVTKRSKFESRPNEWADDWAARSKSFQARVSSDKTLHGGAREQIAARMQVFQIRTGSEIMRDSAKAAFEQAKDFALEDINKSIINQDAKGFEDKLNLAVSKAYLPAQQRPVQMERFKEEGERQVKVQKALGQRAAYEAVAAEMDANPWDVEKRYSPEKLKALPYDLQESYKQKLESAKRDHISEAMTQFRNAMHEGALRIDAEIDELSSPAVDNNPVIRDAMKKELAQFRSYEVAQDREKNGLRNSVVLRQKIEDFNAEHGKDVDAATVNYLALHREIDLTADSSNRERLANLLDAKWKGAEPKPSKSVEDLIKDKVDRFYDPKTGPIKWRTDMTIPMQDMDPKTGLGKTDLFGRPVETWKSVEVDNPAKRELAEKAKTEIFEKMEKEKLLHPETFKDVDSGLKWLDKAIPEGAKPAALQSLQKLIQKPSASLSIPANGRITSFGYANDETPDRNSALGIGAFVPADEEAKIKRGEKSDFQLRQDDLAVSPDVEEKFRGAGVKPGDKVLLQLKNGETRLVRWMDRTANDAQRVEINAKRQAKGEPPLPLLRGRFDLYSPKGRHAYDGMQVVGWRPYSTSGDDLPPFPEA